MMISSYMNTWIRTKRENRKSPMFDVAFINDRFDFHRQVCKCALTAQLLQLSVDGFVPLLPGARHDRRLRSLLPSVIFSSAFGRHLPASHEYIMY